MNDDYLKTLEESFNNLLAGAVEFLPKLLVALLLLLVGFILARVFSKLIGQAVDYLENSKPVKSAFASIGIKSVDVDSIVAVFSKWVILVIFLGAAVDVLGLAVLTDTFDALIDFVPNIFAAVVVAGLSFVAGNVLKDLVFQTSVNAGVKSASFLGNLAKVAVLVFGLPLAVAQLGLDLSLITNNLTVIVAGIMLALGLSFGLGGQDAAKKIVDDLYKNWKK